MTCRAFALTRCATRYGSSWGFPTLLPFLYETRTLQPRYQLSRPIRKIHFGTARSDIRQPAGSPDIGESGRDEDELAAVLESKAQEQRNSTLTEAERDVFDRIEEEASEQVSSYGQTEEGAIEQFISVSTDESAPDGPLSSIFDDAGQSIKQDYQEQALTHSVREPTRVVNTLDESITPPELRSNYPVIPAYTTLDTDPRKRKLEGPLRVVARGNDPKVISQAVDPIIRRARSEHANRVEHLLNTAKSDAELWRVLQNEVFVGVEKFLKAMQMEINHPSDPPEETLSQRKKRQLKASRDSLHPEKQPDLALPYDVIRATYPYFCWLAMRLLRERFPRSPYATAILPTIKSLGPMSYVLGASTELYNEALFLRWVHYKDLHACADLRREMLSRSIPSSRQTFAVFRDAARSWLRARQQSDPAAAGDAPTARLSHRSPAAADPPVGPFELAWWSLEGVRTGFLRWHAIEVEARMHWVEDTARRRRALLADEQERWESEDASLEGPPALVRRIGTRIM